MNPERAKEGDLGKSLQPRGRAALIGARKDHSGPVGLSRLLAVLAVPKDPKDLEEEGSSKVKDIKVLEGNPLLAKLTVHLARDSSKGAALIN